MMARVSGAAGHGGGELAGEGLFVDAAFPGDDHIAAVLGGVEVQEVQEEICPGGPFGS
jgi:hypothetical protein